MLRETISIMNVQAHSYTHPYTHVKAEDANRPAMVYMIYFILYINQECRFEMAALNCFGK